MISYNKLLHLLVDRRLKLSTVCKESGLSFKIVTKINNNENLTLETIEKLCVYLGCEIGDIVEFIKEGD
jgi:DNA-binding Xre family transcriptional regulator